MSRFNAIVEPAHFVAVALVLITVYIVPIFEIMKIGVFSSVRIILGNYPIEFLAICLVIFVGKEQCKPIARLFSYILLSPSTYSSRKRCSPSNTT